MAARAKAGSVLSREGSADSSKRFEDCTGLGHLASLCVSKSSTAVCLGVGPKVEVMVEKGELILSIRQRILDFMLPQRLCWLILCQLDQAMRFPDS